MNFLELAHARYSCRSFDSRPVEPEKLARILEAAQIAPTAKNVQPQRYLVVQSPEGLRKMDQVTPCRFGAPAVLVVCYDKNHAHTTGYGYRSADMDCTISATQAMLAAKDEGIDSIWLLHLDHQKLVELFEIPAHLQTLCLLAIGYADETAAPNQRHTENLSIEDMVSYEHF